MSYEDKYEKHPITKSEIEFLKNLQTEMNTQDHVGQADPRFWVIKGTRKKYGIADGYEDGTHLIYNAEVVAEILEEAVDYIKENFLEELMQEWEVLTIRMSNGAFFPQAIVKWQNGKEKALTDLTDLVEWLEGMGYDDFETANYTVEEIIYQDLLFLTLKEAQLHLKQNYYHYSKDAHPYAMTAWRSPEVEKLYGILHKVDFDDLLRISEKTMT